MANVVAKIMLKMKLVSTDKVVFVNNSLELLGSFVGQTPQKVDDKVKEAAGGVIFIDEAYSISQEGTGSSKSYGKEAIDTIMKHLDPPTAVFIFAGYDKPMSDFMKMNEGLSRRIPFRYSFEPYTNEQLTQIFYVMCHEKGETLDEDLRSNFMEILESLPKEIVESQNAALVSNWVSFAQMERDDRIDIVEAEKNPAIASLLCHVDFDKAAVKLQQMSVDELRTALAR